MYYKNLEGQPYYEPSQEIITRDNLVEISEEEFKQIVEDINKPSAEQVEAQAKALAKQEREELMLTGDVYTLNKVKYQISFTKNDGDGLVQVKSAFELGLTETVISFDNGTNMPIKAEEFLDFATWFVNKRNSFFI